MYPALALLEFTSIAVGIAAGDAMVKRGPVAQVTAGTVHPGKYLVMVSGEVAAVEEAVVAGVAVGGAGLAAQLLLPDIHPIVVDAIHGGREAPRGGSLGVIETRTVAAAIAAADAAVKGAAVAVIGLHLADGLGGKGFLLLSGEVADVEAGVASALDRVDPGDLAGSVVIPRLHEDMGDNLYRTHRFGERAGWDHDAAG